MFQPAGGSFWGIVTALNHHYTTNVTVPIKSVPDLNAMVPSVFIVSLFIVVAALNVSQGNLSVSAGLQFAGSIIDDIDVHTLEHSIITFPVL